MTSRIVAFAVASVWCWTRIYTFGLPRPIAVRRRAEIDSDLWELRHDSTRHTSLAMAGQMFARLTTGVADDLCWRLEQTPLAPLSPRVVRVITTAVFLLTVLWVIPLSRR